jgi:hypothetical protein
MYVLLQLKLLSPHLGGGALLPRLGPGPSFQQEISSHPAYSFILQNLTVQDGESDMTTGQEQRLRRMEREYERRQQVLYTVNSVQLFWL